jgi:hypothetical protein
LTHTDGDQTISNRPSTAPHAAAHADLREELAALEEKVDSLLENRDRLVETIAKLAVGQAQIAMAVGRPTEAVPRDAAEAEAPTPDLPHERAPNEGERTVSYPTNPENHFEFNRGADGGDEPSTKERGVPPAPTAVEIQQAAQTARRIMVKAERGVGHYPGTVEQVNLARCFLWPELPHEERHS